jgi:uncharacterized repeat protein (TIGR01451 family)
MSVEHDQTAKSHTQRRGSIFLVTLFALWVPVLAFGGVNGWTPIGPDGGAIFSVDIDPTTPSNLYAVTRYGVYRSINSGATWQRASVNTANEIDFFEVVADPQSSSRVYVVSTQGNVFRSTDGGTTFTFARFSTGSPYSVGPRIAVAAKGSAVYASFGGSVYRSADHGVTWVLQGSVPGVADAGYLIGLQVDVNNADIVYASCFGGLFKSVDGGATWQNLYTSVSADGGWVVFSVDPSNAANIWIGTTSATRFTTNGGTTWQDSSVKGDITSIQIHNKNSQVVFATLRNGTVYQTNDGGVNWATRPNPFGTGDSWISRLLLDPNDVNRVYLYGPGHIYVSNDAGVNWQVADNGISGTSPEDFHVTQAGRILTTIPGHGLVEVSSDGKLAGAVLDPRLAAVAGGYPPAVKQVSSFALFQERLLVLLGNGKIARTENFGGPWLLANGIPSSVSVEAIAVGMPGSLNAYAATSAGVYRSTDYGENWAPFGNGIPVGASVAAITTTIDPNMLYASIAPPNVAMTVYKSIDGGLNWIPTSLTGSSLVHFDIDPRNAQNVYVRGLNSYDQSLNGGATWASVYYPGIKEKSFDPTDTLVMYDSSDIGIKRSVDGGKTFHLLAAENERIRATALIVNPKNSKQIYVAAEFKGILEMTMVPDIELAYSSAPAATSNQNWSFSVTVKNIGYDDSTNVKVDTQLTGQFTNLAASVAGGTCVVLGSTATCTFAVVRALTDATIQLTAVPALSATHATIHVNAQATSDQPDAISNNNVVDVTQGVNAALPVGNPSSGGGGQISIWIVLYLLALTVQKEWFRQRRSY